MASVVHFITSPEQTQLNRVCYFHFFGVLLASKGSYYSGTSMARTLMARLPRLFRTHS